MTQPEMASGRAEHPSIVFSFLVEEHGWAQADFHAPGGVAHISASYLNDALAGLLEVVDAIVHGSASASTLWAEEPGLFRWEFVREGADLEVRIWVEDGTAGQWFGAERDLPAERTLNRRTTGELPQSILLSTRGTVEEICAAFAMGAQQILLDLGQVDYWVRWQRPFPLHALRYIQSQLKATPRTSDRDDRYGPLVPEIIRRWSRYMYTRQNSSELREMVDDHLGVDADELEAEGLQYANDALLGAENGDKAHASAWADFRKWMATVKRFSDNTDASNREY